jgi:hypothetical protein
MATGRFREELDFFIANQENLVKDYEGKVLVIKGRTILGVYPNSISAYIETQKDHPAGTFMIQPCEPGPRAYTVVITSSIVNF